MREDDPAAASVPASVPASASVHASAAAPSSASAPWPASAPPSSPGLPSAPAPAAPRRPFEKEELKNTVSRNVIASLGSKFLYLGSRVFLPPLILHSISLAEYGLWTTSFILIGYLGMGAFGVSNVYVRHVAQWHAEGDQGSINRLLSTGMVFVGTINLVLLALTWFGLPVLLDLFRVDVALRPTAFVLVFATTAVFLLDLAFGVYGSVLQGLQQIPKTNAVWVASFLLETVLIVAFLSLGMGVYGLLLAFVLRYVVSFLGDRALCRRELPGLRLGPRSFDRAMLSLFYGYGGIVQLSGVLGIVLRSAEKILAGALLGVGATALYDVGEKMPMMAAWIPTSVSGVVMPASSHLHAHGRSGEMRQLYLKSCRYMSAMTGLISGFLAAFAAPILTLWLGHDPALAAAVSILAWFALPYHVHVLTGPSSSIYRGVGEPARELFYAGSQLALLLVLVPIGWLVMGGSIAMINLTVATSMVASALFALVLANRFLGIGQASFAWRVLLPGLVPYVSALVSARLVGSWLDLATPDRAEALLVLAAGGGPYLILTFLFEYQVLCDVGERRFLRLQLRHSLGSLVPGRAAAT